MLSKLTTMFQVIRRSKLSKIKKRGTYSRLLKKYRNRFKQVATNNPTEHENDSSLCETKNTQRCEPENVVENVEPAITECSIPNCDGIQP